MPTATINDQVPTSTTVHPVTSPTEKMRAVEWEGKESVKVAVRARPLVTDPTDVIIKVTTSTICGSDLHMYHNEVKWDAMQKGDVLGHEFVGVVQEVGSQVTRIKTGDRVVVSAVISDGTCWYCQNQMYSLCDTTNPSKLMEELYGHRISGIFGYSHLTGGYEGGQAEFVRVPFADVNTLQIPPTMPDEKAIFLSDIVCTGWHANELGEVKEGDVVAIWGAGPVGLMAAAWAKFRGASRVISIDHHNYRLDIARKLGCETINFTAGSTVSLVRQMVPAGPDVCIDAAGFRFPKTLSHQAQRAVKLESDAMDILTEIIMTCRKGGRVSIVGDYFGFGNQFPIGALMEKGLTMRGSQVYVQKYWKTLMQYIQEGKFDPSFVISHTMPLNRASEAYHMFAHQESNAMKILLKP